MECSATLILPKSYYLISVIAGLAGAFIVAMPLVTPPASIFAVLGFGVFTVNWLGRRFDEGSIFVGAGLMGFAFAGYKGLG